MNFFYVYVLKSKRDNNFYTGFTRNLVRRYKEHQAGKTTSTANRRPLQLVFYEAYLNKYDALRRESYFKSTKGKVTLKMMLKEYLHTSKL